MQAEADPLRISAIREFTEPRFRSRRVGFAARLSNASDRLLQLGHFEKNVNLRLRVVAMQSDAHGRRLKPSAALAQGMEAPAENALEERAGYLGVDAAEFKE